MRMKDALLGPAALSRHLIVDGRRVHLLEWGPALTGPPLVLLHGGGHNAHTWDRVCPGLARDFHCLALDLRGHGDSEWSYEGRYTVPDYQRDLAGVIDSLGFDAVVLVGMSLGGIVSLSYALDFPGRVEALILVDVITRCNLALPHRIVERINRFERAVEECSDIDEAVDRARKEFAHKSADQLRASIANGAVRAANGKLRWKRDRRDPVNVQKIADHMLGLDPHIRGVQCPTLVVKGADSPAFDEFAGREFASRLPRAEFVTIPGAGHNVQEDQPELLTVAIQNFLAGIANDR